MSYASDKLYNGYLRKNMGRIVSTVKPREIIVFLPCLTEHDREAIETKNDFSGKYEAMKLLLSLMKRRENWPEQFIAALEECEHTTMADEIRAEYDKLRAVNRSGPPSPASAAANVVTAHVHPAPSAPHLPDPGPPASDLPAQAAPSEARETNPIQETETPTKSTPVQPAVPVVEVTTPPEPPQVQAQPQTQAVVVPPVNPPPSPESARGSTNPSPPPEQEDIISHQEPEENLEPDIHAQDVPNETINIPEEVEENIEAPLAAEPQQEPCENDDSMETVFMVDQPASVLATAVNDNTPLIDIIDKPIVAEPEPVTVVMEEPTQSMTTVEEYSLTTTTTMDSSIASPVAAELSPSRSLSPMSNLDDLDLTPEKHPVQETSPKEEKAPGVVPMLEEIPETHNAQVVDIVKETEATPSPPAEAENGSLSEEEDVCLSKPGVLMSVQPPDQNNTTMRPCSPDEAPYSGDSGRLEMSEVQKSEPSCQENGFSHKQQGKDDSESPAPSLEEEDVQENVGHVAEEPSILNKEIQAPLIEDSGEPIKEATTIVSLVSETTLISDPSCCTNAGDMSESPAPSLDVEDVEENLIKVVEQPSTLNQENPAPLVEDGGEPIKEVTTVVPLIQETTLISDLSCSTNPGEMSESPAPSLDVEDVEENLIKVVVQPSTSSQENQAPLVEDGGEPIKEATTIVPLVPETTLISDPSCCTNAGDMSESPAPSLDVEDVEENLINGVEQPPTLNQENQTPLIEDTEEQAIEVTPATTITSDNSHYPDEEGISESLAQSLDMEDVRENVGHVAEEPSILNLEVQTPLQQVNGEPANEITTATAPNVEHEADRNLNQEVQTPIIHVNGEPAKEITPVLPEPAPATNDNHLLNDPLVDEKLPDSGNPTTDRLNTRYILTAAGVGACALLIAWRFKH